MITNPLISFVLPAYKAKYFKQAVDSILSQTYTNFELIIVNDCSPDNLDVIVSQFDDKRIRYYKNEKNIGGTDLVKQWNLSISYAKGEFLVLASDDDLYYPNYLEKLVPLTQKFANVNVFRPRVENIDGNSDVYSIEIKLPKFLTQLEFANLLYKDVIVQGIPYYMFRTKALNDNKGFVNFPLAWYSDDATVIQLANNGVASSSEILFKFRTSDFNLSSITNKETIGKKVNATIHYFKWINEYPFVVNDIYSKILLDRLKKAFSDGDIVVPLFAFLPLHRLYKVIKKNDLNLKLKIKVFIKCFILHFEYMIKSK